MKDLIYAVVGMMIVFFIMLWLAAVKFSYENKIINQELKACQETVEFYELKWTPPARNKEFYKE